MALFKISKGTAANLSSSVATNTTHDGFAYFTTDDGKFYIDIKDNETPVIGVNRIPLNANIADRSYISDKAIIADAANIITADLYWANVKVDYSSNTNTSPTFKSAIIGSKNSGIYLTDSSETHYAALYDNGSNLWIGAKGSDYAGHVGKLYLHAGVNNDTDKYINQSVFLGVGANANTNTIAIKKVVYRANNENTIGSVSQPVYVKATGEVASIDYTIQSNVPSGAIFTDTTYSVNTGDNPGQIKVTPSSGSAYNVNVNGLGTHAFDSYPYWALTGIDGQFAINQSFNDKVELGNYYISSSNVSSTTPDDGKPKTGNLFGGLKVSKSMSGVSGNAFLRQDWFAHSTAEHYVRVSTNVGAWKTWNTYVYKASDGNTKAGDVNKPVYISATGAATPISYTIDANVPSGAKFTDTWVALNTTVPGYVPTKAPNDSNKFLDGEATWSKPKFTIDTSHTIEAGDNVTSANLKSWLGLTNAAHFVGKATNALTDGGTENPFAASENYTPQDGDIVLGKDGDKEYIWGSNQWELLGPVDTINASVATGVKDKMAYYSANSTVAAFSNTVGGSKKLWYLNAGVATNSTGSEGAGNNPVYLSNGSITASAANVGSTYKPVWMDKGIIKPVSDNSVLVNLASTAAANTYQASPKPGVTGILGTANGGTGTNIAYTVNTFVYANTTTKLASYTSTKGGPTKLWYLNVGVPTDSNANVGTNIQPIYMVNGNITATNASVGQNTQFIYMANGNITATTATVGGTTRLWYLNAGVATNSSANVGTSIKPIYVASGNITASTSNVGSNIKPIYMVNGNITATGANVGGTKQFVYMVNGNITATTTTVGGGEQPIYSNAGVLSNTTYHLRAHVEDGTANRAAYYSANRTIEDAGSIYMDASHISVNGAEYSHQLNNGTTTKTNFQFSVVGNGFIRDTIYTNAAVSVYRSSAGTPYNARTNGQEVFSVYTSAVGTTANVGLTYLTIGNKLASNANNNAYGRIYIAKKGAAWHLIRGEQDTTGDRSHYFPDATGWIATGGDGTSTGVGNAERPNYLSNTGILTQTYIMSTLHGGTAIGANTSLNSYISIGNYYCDATSTSKTLTGIPIPADNMSAFTMKVGYSTGTGYPYQELHFYNTHEVWRRYNSSTTNTSSWGGWVHQTALPIATVGTHNLSGTTNIDNLSIFGTYYSANNAVTANLTGTKPFASGSGFKLYNISNYYVNYNWQIVTATDTSFFFRNRNNSTSEWREWKQMAFVKARTQIGSGVRPVYAASGGSITESSSNVGGTKQFVYMVNGNITATTATQGGAEQPIYLNTGVLSNTTYHLKAHIEDGAINKAAYYSAARTIEDAGSIYMDASHITVNGTATPANSGSFQVIGTSTMRNILPQTTDAYSLGNPTTPLRWQHYYGTRAVDLEYAGETGVEVNNTSKAHKTAFIVGSSGNGGVYDRTHSFWVLATDQTNGDTWLKSKASRNIIFERNGTENARFNTSGHFIPGSDNTYSLGLTATRWTSGFFTTAIRVGAASSTTANTSVNNVCIDTGGVWIDSVTNGAASYVLRGAGVNYAVLNARVVSTAANVQGAARLSLGNSTAVTAANNAKGEILLWGSTASRYMYIAPTDLSANITLGGSKDMFTMPKLAIYGNKTSDTTNRFIYSDDLDNMYFSINGVISLVVRSNLVGPGASHSNTIDLGATNRLWKTTFSKAYYINDTRSAAFTANDYDKSIVPFFSNNGTPSSAWWAGIHVRGWTGGYSAWELVGPANSSDQSNTALQFRASNKNTAWGNWHQIPYTAYNTAVGDATHPVFVTTTGSISQGSLYAGGTAITLNGTSKAASTASFYAPTGAGTSGYVLTSAGSGAPTWTAQTALTSVFQTLTSSTNTLTIKIGGTEKTATLVNSVSNTWGAGTTVGPTITTTVNGKAGTAVAIPSASSTASGVVTTGNQTFAGRKTINLINPHIYDGTGNSSRHRYIYFNNHSGNKALSYLRYDSGNAANVTAGQFSLLQWSCSSTNSPNPLNFYEIYYFPAVAKDLSVNKSYAILTNKATITVAQGGTGKTAYASNSASAEYRGIAFVSSQPAAANMTNGVVYFVYDTV